MLTGISRFLKTTTGKTLNLPRAQVCAKPASESNAIKRHFTGLTRERAFKAFPADLGFCGTRWLQPIPANWKMLPGSDPEDHAPNGGGPKFSHPRKLLSTSCRQNSFIFTSGPAGWASGSSPPASKSRVRALPVQPRRLGRKPHRVHRAGACPPQRTAPGHPEKITSSRSRESRRRREPPSITTVSSPMIRTTWKGASAPSPRSPPGRRRR